MQGDSPSGIFLLGTAWCLSPCSVPRLREQPGGWQAGQARHGLWPRQVNLRQALRTGEEAGRRLDGDHQVQCDSDRKQFNRCSICSSVRLRVLLKIPHSFSLLFFDFSTVTSPSSQRSASHFWCLIFLFSCGLANSCFVSEFLTFFGFSESLVVSDVLSHPSSVLSLCIQTEMLSNHTEADLGGGKDLVAQKY